MRQLNDVEFAIKRLATGVQLHHAEKGDQRMVKPTIFAPSVAARRVRKRRE